MRALGDLIGVLSALPGDLGLTLDGRGGLGFVSWRGSYDEVSLVVGPTTLVTAAREEVLPGGFSYMEPDATEEEPPAQKVGELLATASRLAFQGAMLSGYKGGCYGYSTHSPLWADEWGDCDGRTVRVNEVGPGFVDLATEAPK